MWDKYRFKRLRWTADGPQQQHVVVILLLSPLGVVTRKAMLTAKNTLARLIHHLYMNVRGGPHGPLHDE
jgi:hypothetical protein